MHYLFYGEDNYSIKQKVKQFKDRFVLSDPSLMNLEEINGAKLSAEQYSSVVMAMPFLSPKRLIIVKNFLLENKDDLLKKEIAKNLSKIPDSSVILFVEEGLPDMRTALFKALNQPKFAFKFGAISKEAQSSWIDNKVKEEGGNISPQAKTKLQIFVGFDLWRTENEIKKLVLFAKTQNRNSILPEDVEKVVKAENNSNIFQFIDALAGKNSKNAFMALKNLVDAGEDEFYIFTMIIYQFRNLFSIYELNAQGLSPQEIAKKAKLHPFVVSKSINLLRHYSRDRLKDIYLNLFSIDKKIKSGLINQSIALDLLIAKLCQAKN